jgi:DNA-nicking Smr family endonuclease
VSDDADLFRRALRDVAPLKKRKARVPIKKAAKPIAARPSIEAASAQRAARSGYDAKLDLHGHTQDAAYEALTHFLESAQKRGLRRVLIITGRSGVLRDVVPRWLTAPPNRGRVESTGAARPTDGGAGALDVLIKKVKR